MKSNDDEVDWDMRSRVLEFLIQSAQVIFSKTLTPPICIYISLVYNSIYSICDEFNLFD